MVAKRKRRKRREIKAGESQRRGSALGRSEDERRELLRRTFDRSSVAWAVYTARIAARITQQELADRIGTTASAISRMESAGYEGHSVGMLRRIADALDARLEVRIVPR